MNRRTKLGLNVLEAALLLGVLGDALLRQTPWGLNVFLWAGALAAAMCALHGRSGGSASWRADGGWLLLPIGFFAAAFAWRDSATLKFLDGLALFVAFALLAWRARGHNIRLGGLGDYALGLGHAAFDVMFASLPLAVSDVQWAAIPRRGAMRHVWAVARGLVIAVPLLFLFGALFMAADAVFEGIMRQTFELDAGQLFSHFFLTLLFAWMTCGFLRGMVLAGDAATTTAGVATQPAPMLSVTTPPAHAAYTSITVDDSERDGAASAASATGATGEGETGAHRQSPGSVVVEGGATTVGATVGETTPVGVQEKEAAARGLSLGAVEVGVVLGLLNVLFACFVVVQFRYFFGGAERVMSITELTYSEYARRGFFELTWVAGLVLPLLLGVHALLRRNSPAAGRIFRTLAGAQVALLFVIMASAVARMRLYQSEYGLTELRLYTTAFMLWLGLVFVWFAWTVLVRDARLRFACGALVAAFVTIGLLHLLNPDAYIVRANAAHARAGRSFDAAYAASLSADAVPALVSALPALSRDEHCLAASELTRRWSGRPPGEDWRAWSLARSRAWRTVAAHQASLSQATCPPPVSSVPVINMTTATEPPPPPKMTATAATISTATTSNTTTSAATTNTATTDAATMDAATIRMINEAQRALAAMSNGAKSAAAGNAKARRRERAHAVKRARTR
ncbi:MAG: hypothetical protein QOD32_1063 [Pyrinomonadaceae bacterium]|jgi:hypothetical protein|nr:hypothetical protein [Pyrinomonadaceae bacterium]